MATRTQYNVYKLEDPKAQVNMPATHKWAVGVHYEGQITQGFGFFDAFRTQKAAKEFLASRGACTLCGEVMAESGPRCECEREAAGIRSEEEQRREELASKLIGEVVEEQRQLNRLKYLATQLMKDHRASVGIEAGQPCRECPLCTELKTLLKEMA